MRPAEAREAVAAAKATFQAADGAATDIAHLLRGRLRRVNPGRNWQPDPLAALKRELRDYNIQTKKWKVW